MLCLSGDPMEVGRTGAKPVFDLDAVGLARLATDLGQGRAPGGASIDPPARFLVGVAEAPGADPSGGDRLAAKADAGATFAQTQPIFDVAQFAAWLDRLAAGPSRPGGIQTASPDHLRRPVSGRTLPGGRSPTPSFTACAPPATSAPKASPWPPRWSRPSAPSPASAAST